VLILILLKVQKY